VIEQSGTGAREGTIKQEVRERAKNLERKIKNDEQ
jgi:hypothetical protein